ncbi:hypothetical protein THAOC_35179 [Thalassiosira oceanica]|uniref:MYND-type domain-containing protein n=1 Tax=Thalassiosira oceanica TaxID=159749 RepID=K0R1B4_THAOC|nr:hypothetical protein THAOC_35179 [Thalassiosira oceanica]|eukprot:EJK46168.1 hypothetical protein THAOC_35179 [Thalassiosira oceanica]
MQQTRRGSDSTQLTHVASTGQAASRTVFSRRVGPSSSTKPKESCDKRFAGANSVSSQTMTLADIANIQSLLSKREEDVHALLSKQLEDVCANCHVPTTRTKAGEAVVLKRCTACRLVKYCSVDCQKAHRKYHKQACKKRAAELKDEQLYEQGLERAEGDFCPICTLPIPLPMSEHSLHFVCCMKRVCDGCLLASERQRGSTDTCPFCRTPTNDGDDESNLAMIQKRIDAGDAEAFDFLANKYYFGALGLETDVKRAIELSLVLQWAVKHWQLAAVKGHAESRHWLGFAEGRKATRQHAPIEMVVMSMSRHFLISAKLGYKDSFDLIEKFFSHGVVTEAQYAEALKGYQDASNEVKSHQRDEARGVVWHSFMDGN